MLNKKEQPMYLIKWTGEKTCFRFFKISFTMWFLTYYEIKDQILIKMSGIKKKKTGSPMS